MTKLIVVFRNFATAPINEDKQLKDDTIHQTSCRIFRDFRNRLKKVIDKITPEPFVIGSKRNCGLYRGADKSLARPTSRYTRILFDGENISFDASLVIYINSTNISPIMIINRIYETQNLLSL